MNVSSFVTFSSMLELSAKSLDQTRGELAYKVSLRAYA